MIKDNQLTSVNKGDNMSRPHTGKITLLFYGPQNSLLKKKTIHLYGKYRIQLVTAFKVLSLISGAREFLQAIERVKVEIRGVRADRWFVETIEKLSPIPVDVVEIREVRLNGVVQ